MPRELREPRSCAPFIFQTVPSVLPFVVQYNTIHHTFKWSFHFCPVFDSGWVTVGGAGLGGWRKTLNVHKHFNSTSVIRAWLLCRFITAQHSSDTLRLEVFTESRWSYCHALTVLAWHIRNFFFKFIDWFRSASSPARVRETGQVRQTCSCSCSHEGM